MEDNIAQRQPWFPQIPDELDDNLKEYLSQLQDSISTQFRKTFDTIHTITDSDTTTTVFTGLTDTPANYAAAASKLVMVDAASTGLEL